MRKPPAAIALAILSATAFAVLSVSCSYLLGDPYPDYAQRILASADLDAIAKKCCGGSAIQEIDSMSYLESSGSSALFVEVRAKDGSHKLIGLGGNDLGDPRSYDYGAYSFGSGVGLDASGNYVSGKAVIPASGGSPTVLALGSVYPYLLSESGGNYFVSLISQTTLGLNLYDSSYSFVSAASIPVASSGSWQLVAAVQGGGNYCFLFQNNGANAYRAFRTPSVAALRSAAASSAWTSLFDDTNVPASYKGAAFSSEYGSAWITVDGPVTKKYSDNGISLTLKPFSGSETSYAVENSGEASFTFDPSGRYWFMYRSKTGLIYKLRTWW
jgi:hypothetical protein